MLMFMKMFLLQSKNDTTHVVWVGIASAGLLLAENQGYRRVIVTRHEWQSVKKISFNKRRFSVQPREEFAGLGKQTKINLFTNNYRK